jgi:hypothetical protein
MRRGYIGISSPVAYDHGYKFHIGPAEVPGHYWAFYNALPYPNPILECPYGLLLLYDEIWFLSRSLCPKNMHGLPYVKFVLETEQQEAIVHKFVNYEDPAVKEILLRDYFKFSVLYPKEIAAGLQDIPFSWEPKLANMSEIFMLSNQPFFGFSGTFEGVPIDLVHLSHLEVPGLELVTNRFTTPIVERLTTETMSAVKDRVTNRATLAESVLLERIPNYLFKDGLYHPCIEEARADAFLTAFRSWLVSHPSHLSTAEIRDIVLEANASFERLRNDVFTKYLSPAKQYQSSGKILLDAFIELLLPCVGTAVGITKSLLEGCKTEKLRWMGFLSSQERRHHDDS